MNKSMRTFQCAGCKSIVTGLFGVKRQYCTTECKKAYGAKSAPAVREITCVGCGKVMFGQIRKQRKFCGLECRGKFGYRPSPKKSVHEPCPICSAPVEVTPSRRSKSKSGLFFCCTEHFDLWQG